MDNHHLALTESGPSDIPHLEHQLDMPLEFTQQGILAGPQGNMNFSPETHATGKDPITRWYHMNDGPWHPPGLTSGTDDGSSHPMVSDMGGNQYVVSGRPNMVPSEFMPQSDSGYGSYHNRPSIANGSVCDDSFETNQDTQSLMGRSMVDAAFSMPPDVISKNAVSLEGSWTSHNQIRIEATIMKCEQCQKPVRTKSELKKHNQRHTKPFKCDVEECPRREQGFSTTNDLDRHKRSVHPTSQALGNRYRCPIGACKNKDKIWPRADNFKAHLKRVHLKENVSDDELDSYVHKPTYSFVEPQDNLRQDVESDYNGYSDLVSGQTDNWPPLFEVSHDMDSSGPLREAQGEDTQGEDTLSLLGSERELADLHIPHAASSQEVYQETTEQGPTPHAAVATLSPVQHDQLPHESEMPEPVSPPAGEQDEEIGRYSDENRVISTGAPTFGVVDGPSEPSSRDSQAYGLPGHLVKTDAKAADFNEPESSSAPNGMPIKLDLSDASMIKKLVDTLQSHGLLEQHGYKKEGCDGMESAKAEVDAGINQNHCHRCSTCGKGFPRKCELKKHEKRHEKPYGCTMPECDKRFGSKNDWKRHENTQHFMLEMWRCDERKDGNVPEACEKVSYRREIFRNHLEKDHHIADQNILEAKLEKCRVGRNCEARFWCGFCQKIVEIKQKGVQAWAERFDHIDEHFSGRNNRAQKEISEWKNFDQLQPRKESSKEDSDDASDCCSSTRTAKAQRSTQEGIHNSLSRPGSKRKRHDGNNSRNSKKARAVECRGLTCCRCGGLITVSQIQCCNFDCEHIPCDNCK
ncbi:hypothetical protein HD806DRAFT_552516 [Xylariaceae sp. AK1471]|nr:hypothetical protein HD806DRAFT_552516 [Xylariaceae sp. AK1471]